ncbi:hypothetical protein RFI_21329 [Reticulomyxa filosa]|uniref:Uncharacterized protein n=1 Tax=Reticulomyxa filosa TaxID=46433 RepID=X6MRG1_RETFI|nr:hypothetical protein RFI_21329 [Reticulomyxa filosa]|eukprot:ETO16032.1 hypothetical protein RFI_21329 [Reticulomyxa filosa]
MNSDITEFEVHNVESEKNEERQTLEALFQDLDNTDVATVTDTYENEKPIENTDPLTSDYQLPPFANEENKQLQQQMMQSNRRLIQLQELINEQKQRVTIMGEHLKNVDKELEHTRAMCTIKQAEIQSEKQITLLSDRERNKAKSTMSKTEKLIQDYQNRVKKKRGKQL